MTTNTTPSGADAMREKLTDIIADHLSGTYHCNRAWEAWNVGTMSQDDFEDVGESDTPAELADVILAALSAAQDAPAVSAGDALPTVHRTAPERIYLCIGDEADQRDAPFDELSDITWSHDQPVDVTVPYVRADLASATAPLLARIAELEVELERTKAIFAASCNHASVMEMDRDARRYRWLRARWGRIADEYDGDSGRVVEIGTEPDGEGWGVDASSIDAAIDVAMKEQGHG